MQREKYRPRARAARRLPAATASGSASVPRTSTRSKPAERAERIAAGGRAAVREHDRDAARAAGSRASSRAAVRSASARSVRPLPRRESRSSTSAAGGARTSPWRCSTSASAAKAITLVLVPALGAVEDHGARRPSRPAPTAWPAHRAAVVDEQAQRAARRGPAAGDQLVGVARPPAGNLKGQVEVEVALSPGPARAQPPVAAAACRAPSRPGAHEQPRGEPPGLGAQLRVGGRAEVGEQRDGGVRRRSRSRSWKAGLVEPADRGRDLLELRRGAPASWSRAQRAPAALAARPRAPRRRSASGPPRRRRAGAGLFPAAWSPLPRPA